MSPRHSLRRLDAYLEGALPGPAGRRMADHLARCPDCARTARQRARVLDAARSVDGRPAAVAAPVLRPHGVPGRLVVGLLAVALLLGGLLTALWMAGAPRSTARAGAGASTMDAVGLVQRQAAAEAPDTTVAELRALGWSVPSLLGAGLQPLQVEGEQSADHMEVAVTWGRSEAVLTVRECRPRSAAAVPTGCGPAPALDGVAEETLPGGLAYRIADDGDEGWVAELTTAQAAYRVEAALPREQAQALLTQLVVSERAGLTELRHEDELGDRLERGLGRLMETVPTGGVALSSPHPEAVMAAAARP